MKTVLTWIGLRSRYVLIVGCLVALAAPALAAFLRPALPFLVALVLAAAAVRIDLVAALAEMARPRAAARLAGLTLLLTPVTALALWPLTLALPGYATPIMVFAISPPISAAASLCFLLGYDARLALQTTLAATLVTPLIGPLLLAAFFGVGVAGPLGLKLFAMIGGGLALGWAARQALGAARVEGLGTVLDGASALAMALFVIPLFDGVGAMAMAAPGAAMAMLALSCALNFGVNGAGAALARARGVEAGRAGAIGVAAGNRNTSLYLATLPPDPALSLFVALYQFPMYATPLIWRLLPERRK